MSLKRQSCEVLLHLATVSAVTMCLISCPQGVFDIAVRKLFCACAVACTADFRYQGHIPSRYTQRSAASQGLGLGLLSIPQLFVAAACAHADTVDEELWLLQASAGITGAAAQLLLLKIDFTLSFGRFWTVRGHCKHESRESSIPPINQTTLLYALPLLLLLAIDIISSQLTEILGLLVVVLLCCTIFHFAMTGLPGTFTLGEGMLVSQSLAHTVAWLARVAYRCGAPLGFSEHGWDCPLATIYQAFVGGVLLTSLTMAAALAVLLHRPPTKAVTRTPNTANGKSEEGRPEHAGGVSCEKASRDIPACASDSRVRGLPPVRLAAAAVVLLAGAAVLWRPAVWSIAFALSSRQKVAVLVYWVAALAVGLPAMVRLAASGRVSNIIVRKGYHVLAVALFLPAALCEPQLLGISLAIAFALLVAVELLRVLDAPFVGRRLDAFMRSFIDSRDGGAVLVTHFTLLLGMAAPIWLSAALQAPSPGDRGTLAATAATAQIAQRASGGGRVGPVGSEGKGVPVWPAGMAGIMILGFGDTAASVVGRLIGRHPVVLGGKKTWEGAGGGVGFTLLGWWLTLACCEATGELVQRWESLILVGATLLSCFLEAVTTQLDNLFVPLHYLTLLYCGSRLHRL